MPSSHTLSSAHEHCPPAGLHQLHGRVLTGRHGRGAVACPASYPVGHLRGRGQHLAPADVVGRPREGRRAHMRSSPGALVHSEVTVRDRGASISRIVEHLLEMASSSLLRRQGTDMRPRHPLDRLHAQPQRTRAREGDAVVVAWWWLVAGVVAGVEGPPLGHIHGDRGAGAPALAGHASAQQRHETAHGARVGANEHRRPRQQLGVGDEVCSVRVPGTCWVGIGQEVTGSLDSTREELTCTPRSALRKGHACRSARPQTRPVRE